MFVKIFQYKCVQVEASLTSIYIAMAMSYEIKDTFFKLKTLKLLT